MAIRIRLPATASVALPDIGARLSSPSALRNAPLIAKVLETHAPAKGRALEIASGTGQHMVAFAATLPGVVWQPSDIDASRRASIDAWADAPNILPAIMLDATAPGWGALHKGQDLIVLVNLLHLISTAEARTLLSEAAEALAPGGLFAIYGPFLRKGRTISEADTSFHASLQASDPEIGYKDIATVTEWVTGTGLTCQLPLNMPANNLMLLASKPGSAEHETPSG